MSVFGVDHAWGRPGAAALKAAGVKFVCRYLSHDTSGKNLTHGEAQQLSDAGLWLVVVWETSASRALSGRAGGVADAKDAASQAKACGMPSDRPIYFAVDWDASSSQQSTINAYLDGAASVLGKGRVGLYAGYGPIARAFDAGKIAFGWQTYAWSGGRWDSRAQLQQYSNDHYINGVDLDYDRAVATDYGQWQVGKTPAPAPAPSPTPTQGDEDMPNYVSLGMSKPVAVQKGKPVRVTFDKEYADTANSHANGAYPGILSGGKSGTLFTIEIESTFTPAPPAPPVEPAPAAAEAPATGEVALRLIETDPAKAYVTSKTYPTHVGDFTYVGWCDAKQHLYVELLPDADGTVNVSVKGLHWAR